MHPVRRNILIRWVGYGVVVVATCAWLYTSYAPPSVPQSDTLQEMKPAELVMPTSQATESIQTALDVLRGKLPRFASVEKIEPSLMVIDPDALEGRKQAYRVNSVFLGPPHKFAVLGGVVYQEGEELPDGRIVKSISDEGVELALGEAVDTMPWITPLRVELNKVESLIDTTETDAEAEQATPQEAAAGTESGVDVDNLPADLSPDEALSILQQIGKK